MNIFNYFKREKTSPEPQASKEAGARTVVKEQPDSEQPQEPKVIYFDSEAFDRTTGSIDYLLPRLNGIHTALSKHLPRPLKIEELKKCFENPETGNQAPNQRINEVLLDVILKESEMKLNGVELDREQARKLVTFPELRPIRGKIADVCFNPPQGMKKIQWEFFHVQDGKISRNQETISAFRESLTLYTTTDDQRERMTIAEDLAGKIGELEKAIQDYKPGSFEIPGAIIYDSYQMKYRPVVSLITKKRKEKDGII